MSTFSPGPVSILLDISMSLSSNSSLWCFSILTTGHIFLLHRVCHCTEGALPTRMLCSEVHVYLIKKGMPLFFGHTHTVVSKLMWSSVVVELVCYFTSLFSFYLIQFTTNFNSLSGMGTFLQWCLETKPLARFQKSLSAFWMSPQLFSLWVTVLFFIFWQPAFGVAREWWGEELWETVALWAQIRSVAVARLNSSVAFHMVFKRMVEVPFIPP